MLIFFFDKAIITAINRKIKVDVEVVNKLPEVLKGKISDIKINIKGTEIIFILFLYHHACSTENEVRINKDQEPSRNNKTKNMNNN